MGRLLKNMGLTLLFLVAALILVNIFVLLPLTQMSSVDITPIPVEKAPEKVEYDNRIVAVDTLAVIRQQGVVEGVVYMDPEDTNLRNPFFWPGKKKQQRKKMKQAPKQPQLSMVIIGEGRKQALMDNVFVREGDMYHGYLVKSIEEHQVVLVDDLGELRIHLTTAANKSGMAQPPSGLIEK
jgi:hypothetical protein